MPTASEPDGGYGWVIVFVGFYIYLMFGANFVVFSVYAIEFADHFGLSQLDVGIIGSLDAAFMMAVGSFLAD